jgi:hypothetical protein
MKKNLVLTIFYSVDWLQTFLANVILVTNCLMQLIGYVSKIMNTVFQVFIFLQKVKVLINVYNEQIQLFLIKFQHCLSTKFHNIIIQSNSVIKITVITNSQLK